MKKDVIKFLATTPKSKPAQFNAALSMYRRSANGNASQVRYMNTLGYSEDRLAALLYDLKKLHSISDLEVANLKNTAKPIKALRKEFTIAAIDSKAEVAAVQEQLKDKEVKIEVGKDTVVQLDAPVERDENLKAMEVANFKNTAKPLKALKEEFTIAAIDSKAEVAAVQEQLKDKEVKIEVGEDTVVQLDAPVERDENLKAMEEAYLAYLEKLESFDVEAQSYNNTRSFAADVSDYTNEDPANQKKDTLKAFILAAKKKLT